MSGPGLAPTLAPHILSPQSQSLAQLKADGNTAFARKEYDAAIQLYDRALKLVPADAADAALLHSNKAACHMMHKRCVPGGTGAASGDSVLAG